MLNLTLAARQAMTSAEVQALKLYTIDYNPPDAPLRFTTWATTVLFDGHEYTPMAIKDGGLKTGSDGKIEPITLTVGNIDASRTIQTLVETYDLIGKNVTRIRMFNNISDPIQNTFKITGAKAKKGAVTFTLSIGFDYLNSHLPARTIFQRYCRWQHAGGFKGPECKYAGVEAECDYSYEDCKAKANLINFGGFPGVTNHHFYF